MKVEVIQRQVKPATIEKLRTDVTRNKQDTDTDKLQAGTDAKAQNTEIAELKKALKILDDRVSLLEQ